MLGYATKALLGGGLVRDLHRTEEITSGGTDNFIWRPEHVLHA